MCLILLFIPSCLSAELCTWVFARPEAFYKSPCCCPFCCQRCLHGCRSLSCTCSNLLFSFSPSPRIRFLFLLGNLPFPILLMHTISLAAWWECSCSLLEEQADTCWRQGWLPGMMKILSRSLFLKKSICKPVFFFFHTSNTTLKWIPQVVCWYIRLANNTTSCSLWVLFLAKLSQFEGFFCGPLLRFLFRIIGILWRHQWKIKGMRVFGFQVFVSAEH